MNDAVARRGLTRVALVMEATTGGTRRHLMDLVEGLDRERFALTVICSTLRDPSFAGDVEKMRGLGVQVAVVRMVRNIDPWIDFVSFLAILRILRSGRFAMVHTHSSKAGFLGRLAARAAGVPAVLHTPHVFPFEMEGPRPVRWFYLLLERIAGAYTDCLVCVYPGQRSKAVQVLDEHKTVVIENGIDTAASPYAATDGQRLRTDLGFAPDDLVVGTVGRLSRQKGHIHLVHAARRVADEIPNAKFLLVGEGELKESLSALAASLGLRQKFRIVSDNERVSPLIAALDVFVLPSLWEGMPYSLLDVMAMGKPVIASRTGGVSDVLVHGETGILVPAGDSAALASAILDLLRQPGPRTAMGLKARERVRTAYGLAKMIGKVERLYESVAARPRAAGAAPEPEQKACAQP